MWTNPAPWWVQQDPNATTFHLLKPLNASQVSRNNAGTWLMKDWLTKIHRAGEPSPSARGAQEMAGQKWRDFPYQSSFTMRSLWGRYNNTQIHALTLVVGGSSFSPGPGTRHYLHWKPIVNKSLTKLVANGWAQTKIDAQIIFDP